MSQYLGKLTAQRVATRTPSDGQDILSWWEYVDYDYEDSTATIYISASAARPVVVLRVMNAITTAFAGTSPTVDIGDGTTVDYWIDQDDIAETTLGDVVVNTLAANADTAIKDGRYLTANAQVTATIGGTNLTAGAGKVLVELVQLA